MSQIDSTNVQDLQWADTQRLEGFAGELRLNLLRLIAIALFYGRHLAEVLTSPEGSDLRGVFHLRITWVCLIWAGGAIILHLWLTRRRVAPWLKYAVVTLDSSMITLLCTIAGGPKTPLILLFFPLVASAPLRMSLRLVYAATAAAVLGYLVVVTIYAWYVIGFNKYYSTPELRIPRRDEAIMILSLLVCGLLAGQLVRQARRINARSVVVK
jgi:hypothetical protein